MVQINALNDYCLLQIFNHVSLQDLLNLEYVCLRWQSLIVTRHSKRISLKMFCSENSLEEFCQDRLMLDQVKLCHFFAHHNDLLLLPRLDMFNAQLIVSKFPNLQMLYIAGLDSKSTKSVEFIVSQLPYLQCVSLSTVGELCLDTVLKPSSPLRHLSLSGSLVLSESSLNTLLIQLDELHLNRVSITESSQFLKPNPEKIKIQKLSLMFDRYQSASIRFSVNLLDYSHSNLTHLTCQYKNGFSLNYICSKNLLQLQYLSIEFIAQSVSLNELFCLKNLKNLKELRLRGDDESVLQKANDQISILHSIQWLYVEMDIDRPVFENLHLMFPNVKHLSLNVGRICCLCSDMPDYFIENAQPSTSVPPPPTNNGSPEMPPPTPLPQLPPIQPVPPPTDDSQVEEVTCDRCFLEVFHSLPEWSSLRVLNLSANRCKVELLSKHIESLPHLSTLSLAKCKDYSLKLLYEIVHRIAIKRPTQVFVIKLNDNKFSKIQRLSAKPKNLIIMNIDPLVNLDIW